MEKKQENIWHFCGTQLPRSITMVVIVFSCQLLGECSTLLIFNRCYKTIRYSWAKMSLSRNTLHYKLIQKVKNDHLKKIYIYITSTNSKEILIKDVCSELLPFKQEQATRLPLTVMALVSRRRKVSVFMMILSPLEPVMPWRDEESCSPADN